MTSSSGPTDASAEGADAALTIPVWDRPVRLVHWLLVGLIAFSWWSAENEQIEWHLWSGYGVLFLLLFRILWGFLGSSTARFASFVRGPGMLLTYLRDPGSHRSIGHTPLGALSVVALLGLIALQIWFGLPLSDEDGIYSGPLNRFVSFETAEWARDIHETLFNVLLTFIALHVAAILIYRLRGKRLLGAMLTGRSRDYPGGTAPMVAASPSRLILCLVLAGSAAGWIAAGLPGL